MKFSTYAVVRQAALRTMILSISILALHGSAIAQSSKGGVITYTPAAQVDPRVLFNNAVRSYKSGDDSTAISELRTYLTAKPNDAQAEGLIGFLELRDGGQDTQAAADLKLAVSLDPSNRSTRNNLGSALLRTGDLKGAIAQFQQVLALAPGDVIAEINLAGAYAKGTDYQQAGEIYNRLIEQGQTSEDIYKNDGYCLGKLGKDDEAAVSYTKATQLNPNDASAWIGAGLYSSRAGNDQAAINDLAKAIELGPTDPYQARFVYGESLAKIGQLNDALKQFKFATDLNPQDYASYYNIGVIQNRLQDYDDAEAAFRQALTLQPGNPESTAGLDLILARKGNFDASVAQLEQIAVQYPNSGPVQAALGTLYSEEDRGDLAVDHWKKAIAINAWDDETRLQLAEYYAGVKNYASAAFEYDFLAHRDPKNDAVQNARGLNYENLGDHKDAQAAFASAVFANPQNAAAWNNLGVTDEELSDRSDAVAAYRKALSVNSSLVEAQENIARLASGNSSVSVPSRSYRR